MTEDIRFSCSVNEKKGKRERIIGERALGKIAKELARRLDKGPFKFDS